MSQRTDRRAAPLPCVIVEDQALFQELLRAMLSLQAGLSIVGTATHVHSGRQVCELHRPQLLLLDLDLPDGDGLEVASHLLPLVPEARVIVISAHASDFVCPPWLLENLHCVISKSDSFRSLREELDALLPDGSRTESGNFRCKALSAREAEIFALIGEGLLTKEIAGRLHISEHTVQTHRKRIARKLGTSGMGILQQAIQHRQAFFPLRPSGSGADQPADSGPPESAGRP